MKTQENNNIRNENIDDIFMRNATLTLLNLLNNEVIIELRRNDKIEKHEVPFFYNNSGTGGFMQDFFIDIPGDCNYPNHAEGSYDVVPKGIVTFKNFNIKTADLTNKFVRGSFNQEFQGENGEKVLKAFSSRLFSLPLNLNFEVKVTSDNLNKTFKIIEKILDFYYKNQVVYFQFRGVRIPAQITFPDTIEHQKKYDFSYTDDTYVNISFNISMETYFPSFDDYSTRYKGNKIRQFLLQYKTGDTNSTIDSSFIDKDYPPSE